VHHRSIALDLEAAKQAAELPNAEAYPACAAGHRELGLRDLMKDHKAVPIVLTQVQHVLSPALECEDSPKEDISTSTALGQFFFNITGSRSF
jgi:hypothetical protein